jgi:hypothetical protein
MMDMQTVLSVILGGVITALLSIIFYLLASRDLKNKAEELKKQSEELKNQSHEMSELVAVLTRVMEGRGWLEVRYNEQCEKSYIVALEGL